MSKLSTSNVMHSTKYFSYAHITWEIRRFSLITRTQMLMCSPKITLAGPIETEWLLYIDLCLSKGNFLVRLEMIPNETIKNNVSVHWSSYVLNEKNEGSFIGERVLLFNQKYNLVVDLLPFDAILDMLSKKQMDTLILKCRILVTFAINREFPCSRVVGIAGLSNDLRMLPTSFLYHDITTTIEDFNFSLHKAMLYQCSEKLSELIEQSTSDMKVNFDFYDPIVASAVFKYIYTGDLRFILHYPSLTADEYLEKLNIPELKNVYSKQILTLVSDVEFILHEINFKIENFKNLSKTVYSPKFEVRNLKCTFKMTLDVLESDDKEKSLHIVATLLESKKKLAVSIDFHCMNSEYVTLVHRRFNKVLSPKDTIGGEIATSSAVIDSGIPEVQNFFNMDVLEITTLISVRAGDVKSEIVEDLPPPVPELTYEKSYGRLVKNMNNLLRTKHYSDFHFLINGEIIKAHKFLVASRSSLFKELFRRHEDLISVKISDIPNDIFHKFLSYLYTGLIGESDAIKLIELYNLGEQYDAGYLQYVTAPLISNLINESNMLRILIFASDKNERILKKTAIDYVVSKFALVEGHPDFHRLITSRADLYKEVQKLANLKD